MVAAVSAEKAAKAYMTIVTRYGRHTIYRPSNADTPGGVNRRPVVEAVWHFNHSGLHRIQSHIEKRLLDQYLAGQTNAVYAQEIRDAYAQRMRQLKRLKPPQPSAPPYPRHTKFAEVSIFNSIDGKGLKYHTFHDIGKYTLFPLHEFRTLFPYGFFGDYEKSEFTYTNTFAIMCREEGLRLAAEYSYRTLPYERRLINYKELMHECIKDMKFRKLSEYIKRDDYFKCFYYDFCLDLIDVYREIKFKDPVGRQLLEAASIFDSIVSILVRSLRQRPLKLFLLHREARKKIMKEFLEQLKTEITKEKIVPINMSEILVTLHKVEFNLDYADLKDVLKAEEMPKDLKDGKFKYTLLLEQLQKRCDHLWRPKDTSKFSFTSFKGFNTGALLWGERGRGKSMILAYLGVWAHDNNWASILVPSGDRLVRGFEPLTQHSCGLYMQPQYAHEILRGILQTNKDLFASLPVNMDLYGKFNLAGWHDNDPPPVIPEYDPVRKTWSDHWKTFFSKPQLAALEEAKAKHDLRLAHQLQEPKTLLDIAQFGTSDSAYATVCIAEILEQLYNTDLCNTLIAFDDFNEWMDSSGYKSYQHHFRKERKGRIPPYDLALVRMFMRFDGHLMRNGVKNTATTEKRYFNQVCRPEDINFPKGYAIETSPLALDDFRNMCRYYNMARWTFKQFQEWEMEAHYMMSQGNWHHFQHSIKETTLLKH
eukprot:TRINITY_DN2656_c0_g1_i15.p1 TRINITY_DN2656_c0_g1~~TRINITY_DN2656_c0_g1_i15.p1  ORF type:complete len:705 (+),score=182.56 TRINITY_DN2656_c0_g1_i15:115-2229(+)